MRDDLRVTGIQRLDAVLGAALDRIFCLRQLDEFYQRVPQSQDAAEFVRHTLDELDVSPEVSPVELEYIPESGPIVITANHPFGGIEGLLLASIILQRRRDLRLLANAHLQRIAELTELFISVNPFEGKRAARENIQPLREAVRWVESGGALLVFPSGEVSHFQFRRARVTDPEWRPSIGHIVRRTGAPAIPAFVCGHNTRFFQLLGCIHARLRTALLAREFLNKSNRRIRIRLGPPVSPKRSQAFSSSLQLARYLRLRTYSLADLDGNARNTPAAKLTGTTNSPSLAPIIEEVDPALLETEFNALPAAQRLARNGRLHAAYASADQIPGILTEIGRLRETTFREAGEGTGESTDIDDFDDNYLHLFLWQSKKKEVVGAYRFAPVDEILAHVGVRGLYTYSLFKYKRKFIEGLHDSIELGRSFVRLEYQRGHAPLMLLWQGIAHYVIQHPKYSRLFGAVSISNDYHPISRQFIVDFLQENCFADDLARHVRPRAGSQRRLATFWQRKELSDLSDIGAMSDVIGQLENGQRGVPVLLRQYLKLGGLLLGFNLDRNFGDALDGLILVDLLQTDRSILQRYMGREDSREFLRYHASRKLGLETPGHLQEKSKLMRSA
ncbi:MAG: GNAT family N-acetyltransferase [Gammaproteobacteria bacterium]|nr:MAG: GNAT family N-acetyltransferase [Gammaproteobacteria bacterium]